MSTKLKPYIVTVRSVLLEYYLVNAADQADAKECFSAGELWDTSDAYLSRTPLDAHAQADNAP